MVKMEPRHLLVEEFGEHVHLLLVFSGVLVERHLGQHLIGERCGHHETGVAGRASEIQEPSLRQHHDAVSIGKAPLVVLRLDVDVLHARDLLEAGHVDFIVEVSDIADDGLVFHPRHLIGRNDVLVARRRHEDIGPVQHRLERVDLVALHRRLQRANRIDLGDHHTAALATQRLRAPLAHFAEAADQRDLAAEHDVGGPGEPIRQ